MVRRLWSLRFRGWRCRGWRALPSTKLYGELHLVNLVGLILWAAAGGQREGYTERASPDPTGSPLHTVFDPLDRYLERRLRPKYKRLKYKVSQAREMLRHIRRRHPAFFAHGALAAHGGQ